MTSTSSTSNVIGWFAVATLTFGSCFWAFWGSVEAFHEGWCVPTLTGRLLQTVVYMLPAMALTALTTTSICFPRLGATLCLIISVYLAYWVIVDQASFGPFILATLIGLPMLMGIVFWFSRFKNRRMAIALAAGLPLLVAIACGIEPAWRVANRFDDGMRGERRIPGFGVELIWAPAGPGWTRDGNVTWHEAKHQVEHLSKDGSKIEGRPQGYWRLPTRAEVVASLTRKNENCQGKWDSETESTTYQSTPDKESPIWDPLAPLIYLWTSESANDDRAWIVVYHGGVFSKPKGLGASSLGFRAVREP